MATPRPPKKKPSIWDRLRESATTAYGEVADFFGPPEDDSGKRLDELSTEEFIRHVARKRAPLGLDRAAPVEERPAILPDLGGVPANPEVAALETQARRPALDPRTPEWAREPVRERMEEQVFRARGKQLGTTPLSENVPEPIDIDPWMPQVEIEDPALSRYVDAANAPDAPSAEDAARRSAMQRTGRGVQSREAARALEANETEAEAEARLQAEVDARLAEQEAEVARRAAMTEGLDPELGALLIEDEERRGRDQARTGGVIRDALLGYQAEQGLREDVLGEYGREPGMAQRALDETIANLGIRAGEALDTDMSEVEGGRGMLQDIGGDIALLGTGVAGLRGLAARGGNAAGRLLRGRERLEQTGRGRAGVNAADEFLLRSALGPTDPEDNLNRYEAAALAGAATPVLEGALKAGGGLLGDVAGAGVDLATRAGQEIAETGRAAGRAVNAATNRLDPATRSSYQSTLEGMGLDDDVVSSLSDRELIEAIRTSAPGRLAAMEGMESPAGRLTGGDKARLAAAGGALAGAGALAASQGGEEGDRLAEGQEERSLLEEGDIASLMGLAAGTVAAGRGGVKFLGKEMATRRKGDTYLFDTPNGKVEVVARLGLDGKKVNIDWIGAPMDEVGGRDAVDAGKVGVPGMREILTRVLQEYPGAKTYTAERISGARVRAAMDAGDPDPSREIAKPIRRPDPNGLLAVAGSLAATGRGRQAKKVVQSLVGRSADEAIKMLRRAGMQGQADNFSRFITGSRVREPAFHGTVRSFDVHTGRPDGLDNWYGSRGVSYFTSNPADAGGNYATLEGPDIDARINRLAEQYMDEWLEDDYNIPQKWRQEFNEWSRWENQYEVARKAAAEAVGGGNPTPNIQPVWLRMQRPIEVLPDRGAGTLFRMDEDTLAVQAFYADRPEEAFDVDLAGAISKVAPRYGMRPEQVMADLYDEGGVWPGEFTALDLDRGLRTMSLEARDEGTGEIAGGQFITDLYREMGFDGIVMDADAAFGKGRQFGRMDNVENTRHYIAFDPGQVKSVTGNRGTFDWTNPNITLGLAGVAMLGMQQRTEGVEGQVSAMEQGSAIGLPAAAMAGMVTRKGVRYLSPRGLRSVSREYQMVANRLGYDPAAIGAGVINQGSVRGFDDFRAQMQESLGERAAELERDLPVIFAESVNLAFDQAFPKIPQHTEKKALGVAAVAQKLVDLARGNDKLTNIWGENSTVGERMKRINSHGVREALKALVLLGDAARWYRADVDNAIQTMTQHYARPVGEGGLGDAEKALFGENPMESAEHQALFKAILAVTSNGNKVLKNVETADKIYRHFLRTGHLTLFEQGTRQKLASSKYVIGAADLLGVSIDDAYRMKAQKLEGEEGADNALDEALDLLRANSGWNQKDLSQRIKDAANQVVESGEAETVGERDTGIWTGVLHTEGIGHARANIHEEQLLRLERVMRQVGGVEEGQPITPQGVAGLEKWLTTRYLGGTQSNVKKAIEVLGDPPSINAPQEILDEYLSRLDEYRKLNNIEPDKLLVQYHSIAGPEQRAGVLKSLEGVRDEPTAIEAGLSDKIGRFFLNLYGIHDEATVDLWATRWYRRVMGYAEVKNGKLNDAPKEWEKGEIRQAFGDIAAGLSRETGRPWGTSDVQALLWYWEKELYRLAGAKDSDKVSFAMGANAVAAGQSGNREWITQQLDQVKALQQESLGMVEQLRRDAMRDPKSGAIPTLKYGDLKSGQGISFAMAPAGLAMAGAEAEPMSDEDKRALGIGLGVGLAGGLAIGLRRGLARRIGNVGSEEVVLDPTSERLLKLFDEAPPQTDRGEELLSQSERIYARAIDYAYPLQKLAEKFDSKALGEQIRVATGWQRAAEHRVSQELGEVLRGAQGHEKKTVALATAERELELRRNGLGERLSLSDDELQEVIDYNRAIPEVAASADGLRGFYRNLLDRKLEEGVIDQGTYDRIVAKGEYYVPMVRDPGYEKLTITSTGGGRFTNLRAGIRRLTKGELTQEEKERALVNPFEQAVHDAMQTERAIAKQRVTNIVAQVVRENPEATAGLIREVTHPAKDITDEGVKKAGKEVAVAENELANRRSRLEMKEKLVEHIRKNYDTSKPRWKAYLKRQEQKLVESRRALEKQQDRVVQLRRSYEERESQARAKGAMEDVPLARLADKRRVQAIVDGKVKTYEVLDEDLFNAWAAAPPQVQDAITRFFRPAKQLLQTTVTALPDFGIANAMRDFAMTSTQYPMNLRRVLSAGAVGGAVGGAHGMLSGKDNDDAAMGMAVGASLASLPFTAKALKEHTARVFYALRDVLAAQPGNHAGRAGGAFGAMIGAGVGASVAEEGDGWGGAAAGAAVGAGVGAMGAKLMAKYGDPAVYERWVMEGGAGFGFFPRTQEDTRRFLNQMRQDGVDPRNILHPGSIWDAIQIMNQAIEEAPRVARFKDALARGESPRGAAAESRDISLDFGRKGSSLAVQRLNESTAFYNAKLQGTSKLVRLLKDPKTWGVGAATLTAPSIALWNINKDNPEYKQRPVWEKNLFWHIPKGEGNGFWLVPKPFEVGFLFASLPERVLDWMHEEDPELLQFALGDMAKSASSGYLPIPTLARPIGEAVINHDLFRSQPVVGQHLQDRPSQRQFDNRTSSMARGVGAITDVAMPGDGISPEKIDHVMRGYTGAVGRMALDATDKAARVAGIDERPTPVSGTAPMVGRFNSRPDVITEPERALRRRFAKANAVYREVNAMLNDNAKPEQLVAAVNSGNRAIVASLLREGDDGVDRTLDYLMDHGEELYAYDRLRKSKRYLDLATQERRWVENQKELSREERRRLITQINRAVGEEARKVLGGEVEARR